ncbi:MULTISPECIES: TDP-N-acetylfucosamine:lipid II N-acetylfucosaminyltransferase [Dyella]|uniref:4-alpha-L-fucosyltransferase n=2 Tax=Dyella TaxID=231454 RepID=A0A4V2NM81_9GAMM|nr:MULTISPECIES: TDP-N-acetylfucosamine:lipid II N-acetylfucosaminyltransferase [Dyella]TBR40139.1 hypothetical protein EYV96_08210 [Dyella terrae]TCI12277.1 hypothetical protein EZM97_02660 [Dyella soli]
MATLAHLFIDEKFIDSAHDSFEAVAPGDSRYFLLDPPTTLKYIRGFEPERVSISTMLGSNFLSSLATFDVVFIHALTDHARAVVAKAPESVNFCWIGWGFDYYELISKRGDRILPLTAAAVANATQSPESTNLDRVHFNARIKRAFARLSSLKSRLKLDKVLSQVGPGRSVEVSMLNKIHHFAPVLPEEGTSILHRGDLHFSLRDWNYGVHETIASFPTRQTNQGTNAIIVGNSATPESNHFDAFAHLSDLQFDGVVVCPLSYGSAQYANLVVQEGERRFAGRFKPLLSFMDISTYQSVMSNARFLYMNQRRQQGLGNILMALYAGTTVVLREENPLFCSLGNLDLPVVSVTDFDPASPPPQCDLNSVRKIVSDHFGRQNQLRRTRALIDACITSRPTLSQA